MTKDQAAFQDAVRELGCIACRVEGHPGTPCDIHHMLDGGERIGEDDVLGLCPNHHRSGRNDKDFVSRHPWRRAFERRYGTEKDLLATTRELINRSLRSNGRTAGESSRLSLPSDVGSIPAGSDQQN